MLLQPASGSPDGPRLVTTVQREGEQRRGRVTTRFDEWMGIGWGSLSTQAQRQALVDLEELHQARCNLASLRPNWHQQALILLQAKEFGLDPEEYPHERPDLAGWRVRTVVLGWAIVESGYALGRIHFEPHDQHPALVAFSALRI